MKRLLLGLLVGGVGLGAGCGSGSSPAVPDGGSIDGVPFLVAATPESDFCRGICGLAAAPTTDPPPGATTATFSQPEPGKLCQSGTVEAGGYAGFIMLFAEWNQDATKVLKPFDATSLGITQVAFTIDSPPSGGVAVYASIVTSPECPGSPPDYSTCVTWGFELMSAPLSTTPLTITTPGPQVAPFTNFKQTLSGVNQTFDTTALNFFDFRVGAGSYDFCVHDFKFLDAAGNQVKP